VTAEEMQRALEILARQQFGPGESITVHAEGCAAAVGDECGCETLTITVPKEQA